MDDFWVRYGYGRKRPLIHFSVLQATTLPAAKKRIHGHC
jgi:hypothetical protein